MAHHRLRTAIVHRRQKCAKERGARGTLGWTAPETAPFDADKKNEFYYAADVWSLGLVILFILFGRLPLGLELTREEREEHRECIAEFWYRQKLLRGGEYEMKSTKNRGEVALRNALVELYAQNLISAELFALLHDAMLVFDPRKRASCKEIWNHRWFDEYRELCRYFDSHE